MNQAQTKNASNKGKTILVKPSDLPLSCPSKDVSAWNSHPRVYLDLSKTNEATCFYCNTHYKLENS